jgi:hypothetical protein
MFSKLSAPYCNEFMSGMHVCGRRKGERNVHERRGGTICLSRVGSLSDSVSSSIISPLFSPLTILSFFVRNTTTSGDCVRSLHIPRVNAVIYKRAVVNNEGRTISLPDCTSQHSFLLSIRLKHLPSFRNSETIFLQQYMSCSPTAECKFAFGDSAGEHCCTLPPSTLPPCWVWWLWRASWPCIEYLSLMDFHSQGWKV